MERKGKLSSVIMLVLVTMEAQAACNSSACLTCSANPNFCLTCKPGYYLQPANVGLCYSYCPTGYTWNSGTLTCDGTPDMVVDYVLNTIAPTIYDRHRNWPALNGDSAIYYYNPTSFEISDPIPSKTRGYHFDGVNQYVKLQPKTGEPSIIPVVGTNASAFVWMMLETCGSQRTLFGKNDAPPSNANLFLIMIRSSPCVVFSVLNASFTYGVTTITTNTWHNVLVTMQYNPSTGKTDVAHYLDLVTDVTQSASFKMVDDINGQACIGQEYDNGPVKSDFFKGYIWQVTLYNYAISFTEYQAQVLGPAQPASATFPLSTCGLTQYVKSDGTCGNCLAACTNGCVDGTDCSYCVEDMCAYCTTFGAGPCAKCINNASVVAGTCTCDDGYYYALASNSCPNCDVTCAKCSDAGSNKCTGCKSGAELSAGTNSACKCSSGYYTLTGADNCQVCDSTCLTCQGAGSNQCTACKGVATLNGSPPGTCICPTAHYPSTDSSNCQPCHTTCLTCQGGSTTQCNTCKGAAVLSGGTVGTCDCPSTHFPSSDSSNCQPCDGTCLTCQGSASIQCTSCKGVATLNGSSPGACTCPTTHYPSSDSSNCQPCDSTCLTCQGSGPSVCLSCKGTAVLSSSPGQCTCLSTYYGSPDSGNCLPCDSSCGTCSSAGICDSCLAGAGLVGGLCSCLQTYYPNPDPLLCALCDLTCGTCSGAGTCDSCMAGAELLSGLCSCMQSFYPDPDPRHCTPCDHTCLSCQSSGPTDCISCKGIANLQTSTPPSPCQCPTTATAFPDSSNCVFCHFSCLNCNGPTNTECTTCYSHAYLVSPPVSQCICAGGYYSLSGTGTCLACDSTCADCIGSGSTQCTLCKSAAQLENHTSPGACTCNEHFFPDPDSSRCKSCYLECLTCTSGVQYDCSSCHSGAELYKGGCQCKSGSFPSPNATLCEVCDDSCSECAGPNSSDCTACRYFAELKEGACLCLEGYHLQADFTCVPNEEIVEYFSGKLVSHDTVLTLMFSATLAAELRPENITVDLHPTLDEIGNFTWHMQSTVPCSRYNISLTSQTTIPTNSTAIVTFHNPTSILSTSNAVLSSTSLETLLTISQQNYTSPHTSPTVTSVTHTTAHALIVSTAVSSVFTGNSGGLWMLINSMQLLTYIPLSYIPLPPTTRSLLTGTNSFSILPNLWFFLPTENTGLPKHAVDFGFKSSLFLYNSSAVFTSFLGFSLWLGLILLLKLIPYLPIQIYANEKLKGFKWNYVIRFWIEVYMQLAIAAGLQLYVLSNTAWVYVFSAVLSIIIAVALLMTPYFFVKKLLFSKEVSEDVNSWLVLTEEFKGKNRSNSAYYPLFCSRRVLYALTQLYLQSTPILQGVVNVAHSAMVTST